MTVMRAHMDHHRGIEEGIKKNENMREGMILRTEGGEVDIGETRSFN